MNQTLLCVCENPRMKRTEKRDRFIASKTKGHLKKKKKKTERKTMAWRKMLTNLLISLTPWLFCAGVSLDVSLNPIVNCLCWSYLKSSTHTPSVSASMVMPIKPHSLLMNQERSQRVNGFDLVPIVNPQLG